MKPAEGLEGGGGVVAIISKLYHKSVQKILDVVAVDQKGILSRGRSPIAFNFRMVYKKINYSLIRSKIGAVVISKQAQDPA